ncbi:MAG: hypothetical protein Q7J23_00270 [Nitrosomonas sp.]|nr:hypothetical protein [Nitrosomonas sp.]
MRAIQFSSIFSTALLAVSMSSAIAIASQDISEIQNRFNAETINKRFNVPTDAALTSALKEATQRGTPTKTQSYAPGCFGLGCILGQSNFGYGSYFGGYSRPYYGGLYGVNNFRPYYSGW